MARMPKGVTLSRSSQAVEAECDARVRRAELDVKVERRQREADQAVHQAVHRQLEELRAAAENRAGRATASPPAAAGGGGGSSAALLALRVKQLEEAVRERDVELQALKSGRGTTFELQQPPQPLPLPDVQSSGAAAAAALQTEVTALSCRLREWERGMLQQELCSAADRALRAVTPPSVSVAADAGRWSAADAAEAVKGLVQQVSELRDALSQRDAKLLELSAVSSGTERQCAALSAQLRATGAELQAAVVAEKTGARQLAAVMQERDALRRALAVPTTLPSSNKPDTVSGRLEAAQAAAAAGELQALVADLQGRLEGLRQEAASAAAGEAAARGETAAAKARAEAADAKCVQLEKEADGLALDVARLQVGGGVVAVDSPETRGSVSTPQLMHGLPTPLSSPPRRSWGAVR